MVKLEILFEMTLSGYLQGILHFANCYRNLSPFRMTWVWQEREARHVHAWLFLLSDVRSACKLLN